MEGTKAGNSHANDSSFVPPKGEPELINYHQQKLVDSAYAVHESCYLSKDNVLARTEILRQLDQLKADGGLTIHLFDTKESASIFKGSKTDESGNITELNFPNCVSFLPDTKVVITPDGAKINGKNYPTSLKEEDRLLVDFTSAEIDNPLKFHTKGNPNDLVSAPEISSDNKAMAKQGVEAILSGDVEKLRTFAKTVLADPVQAEKVFSGISWQEPHIAIAMQILDTGEHVLSVGSGFLGRLQIDSQGKDTFFPSEMNPMQSQVVGLGEIANHARHTIATNYSMAASMYEQTSRLPSILINPSPERLVKGYHQLFDKSFEDSANK